LRFLKNKWVILTVIIVIVGACAAYLFGNKEKPQYYTSAVQRGDISDVVEATGTINAVTTVQVGSQVSGTISQLFADFNSQVKKGQVIARIDPRLFEGTLLQAKADLENARANLAVAKATLEKSKAALAQAKQDYERTTGLTKEGVMSEQQLEVSKANYDSAVAQVNASQASVVQADAQVKQKTAAVNVAQTNLDYTVITAPIDGTVIARSVDVGQTVAASLQAPTLFTIAQDLTKMQVYTATDESDVGMIRPGQKVTFRVDAFPKDRFEGVVDQVRMNATTVQNVVTYNTIINFANPERKLFPGMTAYVSIPVAEAYNVVKIPNGALRYRPDDAQAILAKYGMGHGQGAGVTPTGGTKSSSGAQGQAQRKGSDDPSADKMPSSREVKPESATVWKLRQDGTIEPVRLRIGITDRTVTEVKDVLKGELKEGDQLVIGSSAVSRTAAAGRPGAAPGGARR
jgi:HlyD family secretion protein